MDTKEKVCKIIKRAKELIATDDQWCKNTSAMNIFGLRVQSNDPEACRFCAVGATWRAAHELDMRGDAPFAISALDKATPFSMVYLNDAEPTKLADVHAAFDLAMSNQGCQG